jgi:hypothetical protein
VKKKRKKKKKKKKKIKRKQKTCKRAEMGTFLVDLETGDLSKWSIGQLGEEFMTRR